MEDEKFRSIDGKFGAAALMRRLGRPVDPVMVGRFELVREIDFGTYGTVYEAIDRDLDRRVAIKVLDLGDSDVALREGKALAEIRHPNVVLILEHGLGSDYRYFVMELLEGSTLRVWWKDKTPSEIVAKFIEVARGLAAVHAKDLVHRDFKPSNVRIGADGRAVVVDFGLARHLDSLADDPEQQGVFAGTIDYAPPERLRGEIGDGRADQFSVCVALWEALSGTKPFGYCHEFTPPEERIEMIRAGIRGTPRGARRVVRAVRRGLSFAPSDRFPSMKALAAALAPKPRRWAWRDVLLMVVVVVALVVLVAGALTRLTPARDGGSIEFVTNARMSLLGQGAIVAAREGSVAEALSLLDEAELAKRSKESSRQLALASVQVALEFERRSLFLDASLAWFLTTRFARSGDIHALERRARHRMYAARNKATLPPH